MVNLFRNVNSESSNLTAALLALLEHSDRTLLRAFLEKAQHPVEIGDDAPVRFVYPDTNGAPGTGVIATPEANLSLLALPPGEPSPRPAPAILITPTGENEALSWEEIDQWLANAAEQYDPDSRTGFLIRQFRDFLPDAGIEYFPGFDEELLEDAPDAFGAVAHFFDQVNRFFDLLTPLIAETWQEASQLRMAAPDDLLHGYSYRDYTFEPIGPHNFLRAAYDLTTAQFQLSVWFVPGDPAHQRLYELLLGNESFRKGLQALRESPQLRIWSEEQDVLLDLEALETSDLEGLVWDECQVGVQRSVSLASLSGPGLLGRVRSLIQELLESLSPTLETVH